MSWFYRFEAKGIQPFLFATQHLNDVLGGSALVLELCRDEGGFLGHVLREARSGESETRVLYQAAGGATIRFANDDHLRRFAARWPMEVQRFAPGLQVVQAWVEQGSTDRPLEALARRLATARQMTPPQMPQGSPVMERAPQTGRPAVATPVSKPRPGAEGELLDEATDRKRWAAERYQDDLFEAFAPTPPEGYRWTRDLSLIGGGEGARIAVIHADGNSVGRVVRGLDDPDEMARFSESLRDATTRAVRAACERAIFPSDKERRDDDRTGRPRILAGRPIVLGGDDLTAIVRADRALDFVETFCRSFERITADLGLGRHGGGFTASAGVAFCRPKYPFLAAYTLADALCTEAKANGRALVQGKPPALVSFQRVTTALAEAPRDQRVLLGRNRARVTVDRPGGDDRFPVRLPMGPYLVSEDVEIPLPSITAIRRLAHTLNQAAAPKGTLREFLTAIQQTPDRAEVRYGRMIQVQEDTRDGKAAWKAIQASLAGLGGGEGPSPWWAAERVGPSGKVEEVAVTPWADALALARLDRMREVN